MLNKTLKQNLGLIDRGIRITLGVVLWIEGIDSFSSFGVAMMVVGVGLVLSGLVGVCPLFSLFKINTYKFKEPN